MLDKLRVVKLRFKRPEPSSADRTTEDFLRDHGFSERMIDGFFRAFYGGIFLERDLRTSSRMFEFTFRMFSEGFATLPADGMQAIPDQLAAQLPRGSLRLNAAVYAVEPRAITLESGERIAADAVVVATDAGTAERLLPGLNAQNVAWRSVTGVYFSAPESPLREPIIALNGGPGLVNNVCVLSDIAPSYAPEGKSLVSVSVLGLPELENLEALVRAELETWFGPQVHQWSHLRTYQIPRALPEQAATPMRNGVQQHNGIFICGDHCRSASIEGAVISGMETAGLILKLP